MKPPFTVSVRIDGYTLEDSIWDTRMVGEMIITRAETVQDAILSFGMALMKLGLDIEDINPVVIALFDEERKKNAAKTDN